MELTYEFTPEDQLKYQKHYSKSMDQHKYFVIMFGAIILLFLFADVIYTIASSGIGSIDPGAFLISLGIRFLICMALLGLIIVVLNYLGVKATKTVVGASGKNGLFCEHKLILTENELIEMTDVNISHYSWHGIGQVELTDELVLLPVTLSAALVIPRRTFRDQQHLAQFVETAHLFRENAQNKFIPSYRERFEERSLEASVDHPPGFTASVE